MIKRILFVFLLINSLLAQDSARIKTDLTDKRIYLLTKTWYSIPDPTQTPYTAVYISKKMDSAKVVFEIHSDGSYKSAERTGNLIREKKGKWILYDDDLFLQTSQNKDEFVRFNIQRLHDTALVMTFKEIKNITEPFLCRGMYIFQKTEIPAQFGKGNKAFEEYIKSAFSIERLKDKSDQDKFIEFVVTCEGEIYVPFSIEKRSELENYILDIIRKMPRWTPALMNGQKVNELKKYQIDLTKLKFTIRKV